MRYEISKSDAEWQNALIRDVRASHSVQAISFWDKALTHPVHIKGAWFPAYEIAGRNFLLDGELPYRRPMLVAALETLLERNDVQNIFLINGDVNLQDYLEECSPEISQKLLFSDHDETLPTQALPANIVVIPAQRFLKASMLNKHLSQLHGNCAVIMHNTTLVSDEDTSIINFIQRWMQQPNITVGISTETSAMLPEIILNMANVMAVFPDNKTQWAVQRVLDRIGQTANFHDSMQNSHCIAPEYLFIPVPQRTMDGMNEVTYQRNRLLATDPDIVDTFCILYGHSKNTVELTRKIIYKNEQIYNCGTHWLRNNGGLWGLLHELIFFDC